MEKVKTLLSKQHHDHFRQFTGNKVEENIFLNTIEINEALRREFSKDALDYEFYKRNHDKISGIIMHHISLFLEGKLEEWDEPDWSRDKIKPL